MAKYARNIYKHDLFFIFYSVIGGFVFQGFSRILFIPFLWCIYPEHILCKPLSRICIKWSQPRFQWSFVIPANIKALQYRILNLSTYPYTSGPTRFIGINRWCPKIVDAIFFNLTIKIHHFYHCCIRTDRIKHQPDPYSVFPRTKFKQPFRFRFGSHGFRKLMRPRTHKSPFDILGIFTGVF